MSQYKWLTPEQKKRVFRLKNTGKTCREIADIMECSFQTVSRILRRINMENSFAIRTGSGRPRCSTVREDRQLLREYKKSKSSTSVDLQKRWNVEACVNTVRNRLREHNLQCYSRRKKPRLTAANIKQRLAFCRKYKNWTVEDWKRVVFSDETNIEVSLSECRKVWRKKGESLQEFAIQRRSKHPNSIMIWGCLSKYGFGNFHVLEGRLNSERYIDILNINRVFRNWNIIFQQDVTLLFE